MPTAIPDLWSDDIKVDVVSPLAILRTQAGLLERKTGGLLRADVATTQSSEGELHALDIVAPALHSYRKTILTARHSAEMSYPATVRSDAVLLPKPRGLKVLPSELNTYGPRPDERIANTQDELIDLIGQILRSGYVRSLIESLITKSNETTSSRNGHAEADETTSSGQ